MARQSSPLRRKLLAAINGIKLVSSVVGITITITITTLLYWDYRWLVQGFVISGLTALCVMRTMGRYSARLATAGDWDPRVTGSVREQERWVQTQRPSRTPRTPDSREFWLTLQREEKYNGVTCLSNGAHSKEGRGRGLEAPEGQGCPACNCYVYHADQVRGERRD